jgi:hypothetical protein
VWAQPPAPQANLRCVVAYDVLIDSVRRHRNIEPTGDVVSYRSKEWTLSITGMACGIEVIGEQLERSGKGGDVANLASLAVHPNMLDAAALVDVLHLERDQFRSAQRVIEQGGEDRTVALAFQR